MLNHQSHNYPFIYFLSPPSPFRVTRKQDACPQQSLTARGRMHSGQVANPSQSHTETKQTTIHPFTHTEGCCKVMKQPNIHVLGLWEKTRVPGSVYASEEWKLSTEKLGGKPVTFFLWCDNSKHCSSVAPSKTIKTSLFKQFLKKTARKRQHFSRICHHQLISRNNGTKLNNLS